LCQPSYKVWNNFKKNIFCCSRSNLYFKRRFSIWNILTLFIQKMWCWLWCSGTWACQKNSSSLWSSWHSFKNKLIWTSWSIHFTFLFIILYKGFNKSIILELHKNFNKFNPYITRSLIQEMGSNFELITEKKSPNW
jgi:hypothetical protein